MMHQPIDERLSDANQAILVPIIRAAVERHGSMTAPLFRSRDFAREVEHAFGLRNQLPAVWCRDVLRKVDSVAPLSDPDHWSFLGADQTIDVIPTLL